MPIFNQTIDRNNLHREEFQIQTIINRTIYLHEAISIQQRFDEGKLWDIARLKQADLQDINTHQIKELSLLLTMLTDADREEKIVLNSEVLIEPLREFETEHGNYLDLVDLAITNSDSLQYRLPEFALFYLLFIRFTSYDPENMLVSIDLAEILKECTEWSRWRKHKIHLNQPSYQGHSGLIEKSAAQALLSTEWLTDIDITRACLWTHRPYAFSKSDSFSSV